VVARIPRSEVVLARLRSRADHATPAIIGDRLHLPGPAGQAHVEIELHTAVSARLLRRTAPVRIVSVDVADPAGLVHALA
jgi:hypothetical protein